MHSIDQPAAESRFKADCLEICQPVGLGPATNGTGWVLVPPVVRGRGDVRVGDATLLIDVGDVEGQRELALRGRPLLYARSAAMPSIRPMPPSM